jgi:hypothetical protein
MPSYSSAGACAPEVGDDLALRLPLRVDDQQQPLPALQRQHIPGTRLDVHSNE